jgi:hypothetical protein
MIQATYIWVFIMLTLGGNRSDFQINAFILDGVAYGLQKWLFCIK